MGRQAVDSLLLVQDKHRCRFDIHDPGQGLNDLLRQWLQFENGHQRFGELDERVVGIVPFSEQRLPDGPFHSLLQIGQDPRDDDEEREQDACQEVVQRPGEHPDDH